MERAVDNIEAMFNKAEADLNLMQTKLEYQLGQKQNPLKMVKQLQEIKDEYSQIARETAAIQEAQKDFIDYFKSQVLTITELLKKMEQETGQSPEVDPAIDKISSHISLLLGISEGKLKPFVDEQSQKSQSQQEMEGACAAEDGARVPKKVSSDQSVRDEKVEVPAAAGEKRANGEFIEISSEEFSTVSDLIKKRAKLEEVNKVYKALWQFFKEDKNTGMLTPKEMNSMGLRVTGATGEAKLKILRALKICQISRTGDVKLL